MHHKYFLFLTTILQEFYFIRCGLAITKISPQPMWNATFTDKLRQDLLLNYDKFARPAQHSNVTLIKMRIDIRHLEINELKQQITVYTYINLQWKDEKLKWYPDDYGGLKDVRLAEHEIWQPDIMLHNGVTPSIVGQFSNTQLAAHASGTVQWIPPSQFTAFCQLNFEYWPFDTQECQLYFGSWTYSSDVIDLEMFDYNKNITGEDIAIPDSEWAIIEANVTKNLKVYEDMAPYPSIKLTIKVSRISPSYKAIIITPAFAVLILILSTFWLPPDAGEKIIINSGVSIIICMFLLYFTQKIPAMGSNTPLIVLFYGHALYLVVCTMIESILVIWLSKTKHTTPLPWIIKKTLTGTFGIYLGLSVYIKQSTISHRVTAEEMRDNHVTDLDDQFNNDDNIFKQSTKPSTQQEWILLAASIDRLSFCFFTLISLIMALVYSL